MDYDFKVKIMFNSLKDEYLKSDVMGLSCKMFYFIGFNLTNCVKT